MAISAIHARIEDGGLGLRLAMAGPEAAAKAGPLVRAVALAGVKKIKIDMPVDTGRARASWGIWTPGDIVGSNKDGSQGDAVFTESGGGLTVTQGTNVPYVEALENGHSTQAPAGFIQRDADTMGDELVRAVSRMLDEIF